MVAAAREQRPSAQGLKEFKAALGVLLPALHGLSQRETADLLQLSVSRVGSLPAEAHHPSLPPKGPHGGRRRQLMTPEEETALLVAPRADGRAIATPAAEG